MKASFKTTVAIRAAWACLRQHRWRSLATLAICGLGTAGVVIAGMLNQAHKTEMQSRLRNLGSGLLTVSPSLMPASPGRASTSAPFNTLDASDAFALAAQLPQLERAVPVAVRSMTVRLGPRALRVQLLATTPEYALLRGLPLERGRFFAPAEAGQRVIVLGHAVSAELQSTLPNDQVCIGRASYHIVGVLSPQGLNFAGEDEDRQVFVPLETFEGQIANRPWLSALYLQMSPGANSKETMRDVEKLLRDRHGRWPDDAQDIVVRDFADLAAQQSNLLATVTWTVTVTSALLVLMGAVGIATLMVLVVRRRRTEIGLRRALGATPSDVALQLFTEGVALATAGVLLGLGLGIVAMAVVAFLRETALQIDPVLVLLSAAFSLGSSALACTIPAILAARLEPSNALRS